MAFADLFADNVLVRWLTGNRQRYDLVVSMTGIKLGERLLQIGCADAGLLAALGGKVGFTGRTCGVDEDAAVADRARARATAAGVLVEVETAPYDRLPFEAAAFDLVVVRPGTPSTLEQLRPAFGETLRVLRPGGRAMIVADAGWPRATATPGAPAGATPAGRDHVAVAALTGAGFRGARLLAEREGLTFLEAIKARD